MYNDRWPLKWSLRSLPSLPIGQDVQKDLRKTRADYRPEEEILVPESVFAVGDRRPTGGSCKRPESQLLVLRPGGGAALKSGQDRKALVVACCTHRAGKALGKATGELIPPVKMKGGGPQRGGVAGHPLQGPRSTTAGQAGRKVVCSSERVCWSEKRQRPQARRVAE